MKKKFTLIELIIVIAILTVLASIIIPNIKSATDEAFLARAISSIRNMQTISDMHNMKENGYPTTDIPTFGNPQEIDFNAIYPKYSLDGKDKDIKYWVDDDGMVWGSTGEIVDSVKTEDGKLYWRGDYISAAFNVYEVEVLGGKINKKMKTIKSIKNLGGNQIYSLVIEPNKNYLVNSYDKYLLETPYVGELSFPNLNLTIPENETSRTLTLVWKGKGKSDWIGYESIEVIPDGTSISYEFSTSEDGKTYSNTSSDITTMPDSKYLKSKITLTTTNSNKPILQLFKVIFKPVGEDVIRENELDSSEIPVGNVDNKEPDPIDLSKSNDIKGGTDSVVVPNDTTISGSEKFEKVIDIPADSSVRDVIVSQNSNKNEVKGEVNFSTSNDGGNTWSPPSLFPETLPIGDKVKVEVTVPKEKQDSPENEIVIGDIIVITNPDLTPVVPVDADTLPDFKPTGPTATVPVNPNAPTDTNTTPDNPSNPSDGNNTGDTGDTGGTTPTDPVEEWILVDTFTVTQDGTEIVDWLNIEKQESIPVGTRIRYEFQYSADNSTWSNSFTDINQIPNSRYMKVLVFFEKLSTHTGANPTLEWLLINFNFLDGSKGQIKPIENGAVVTNPVVNKFSPINIVAGVPFEVMSATNLEYLKTAQISANRNTLVFIKGVGDIYYKDVNTGETKLISDNTTLKSDLTISDDGTKITWVEGSYGIKSYNSTTGILSSIGNDTSMKKSLKISGDGSKLVWHDDAGTTDMLYSYTYSTQQVKTASPRTDVSNIAISTDGSKMTWISDSDYELNLSEEGLGTITYSYPYGPYSGLAQDISGNGEYVAWVDWDSNGTLHEIIRRNLTSGEKNSVRIAKPIRNVMLSETGDVVVWTEEVSGYNRVRGYSFLNNQTFDISTSSTKDAYLTDFSGNIVMYQETLDSTHQYHKTHAFGIDISNLIN